MHLCSYSLDCKEYKIDFEVKKKNNPYRLIKNENEIWSFYPIKKVSDFYLKLSLDQETYHEQMHHLHKELFIQGFVTLLITFVLAILFSFYALYPLRNALLLTREFIKDILHDFNTPIATMRLNVSLLKREVGSNNKIKRIERSIENVLWLEENLKNYLQFEHSEKECFFLLSLIEERVNMIEQNYPNLTYVINIDENIKIESFKKEFVRILDNIIVNASKYNKKDGNINIEYSQKTQSLHIIDTGKGIKHPKQIFKRFYKEHERGLGIGLHIVKKLTEMLGIKIEVKTVLAEGTEIILYIGKIEKL